MRRRVKKTLAIAAGVVVLVGGAVLLLGWDLFVNRIGTVREGVLYRSAQLAPDKLDRVIDAYGIRTVVNLREHADPEEEALAAAKGARYVWLPSEQVPKPENIQRVLDLLDHPDNLPLLVHCEHGVGRTGVISGLYRLEYEGWTIEDVLDEARFYAFGGSYWDGQDKTEFLRRYVPRHLRKAASEEGKRPAQATPPAPPAE